MAGSKPRTTDAKNGEASASASASTQTTTTTSTSTSTYISFPQLWERMSTTSLVSETANVPSLEIPPTRRRCPVSRHGWYVITSVHTRCPTCTAILKDVAKRHM